MLGRNYPSITKTTQLSNLYPLLCQLNLQATMALSPWPLVLFRWVLGRNRKQCCSSFNGLVTVSMRLAELAIPLFTTGDISDERCMQCVTSRGC
jgi:hypothetical protein